jgi:hypothetical protein
MIALLMASSCKKESPLTPSTTTPPHTAAGASENPILSGHYNGQIQYLPPPASVLDTLPQSVYTISRDSALPYAGFITVAPYNPANTSAGYIMVMDGAGHLVAQKTAANNMMDFRRWVINGQVRYTWHVNDPSYYVISSINAASGYTVIADENLNELKRVSFIPKGWLNRPYQGTDLHDFVLLTDDHYFTMTYYQKAVSNCPANLSPSGSALVAVPLIQEVLYDQVIWQWDASDYPEFYSTSVESNAFWNQTSTQDYMHMNSMMIDPRDNNLILSFRNLDQIVKINHATGNIMWRLGGSNSDFTLAGNQVFLRQHFVRLEDNNQTLIVFDNGEVMQRPYSRILEFQLNESAHQITAFKSYDIPEPFTQYMGSVQKIGTHYFIGGGTAKYVLEVDPATGKKYLEMSGTLPTYRAYKFTQ